MLEVVNRECISTQSLNQVAFINHLLPFSFIFFSLMHTHTFTHTYTQTCAQIDVAIDASRVFVLVDRCKVMKSVCQRETGERTDEINK